MKQKKLLKRSPVVVDFWFGHRTKRAKNKSGQASKKAVCIWFSDSTHSKNEMANPTRWSKHEKQDIKILYFKKQCKPRQFCHKYLAFTCILKASTVIKHLCYSQQIVWLGTVQDLKDVFCCSLSQCSGLLHSSKAPERVTKKVDWSYLLLLEGHVRLTKQGCQIYSK